MLKTLIRGSRPGPAVSKSGEAEPAAAAICDQHGAALLVLATVLANDRGWAEAAVVGVISDSFPMASMAVPMPAAEMRRHLAKRVYLLCGSRSTESGAQSNHEDVALALTRYGQLTYRAVADLLGLSGAEVAQYLGSALRRGALDAR